ncbi:MAG: hypothetical protein CL910_11145 [Deltaproteobacteria bacterium]|nr:hypothetical protein [Deltaproteobacteria bacterium]
MAPLVVVAPSWAADPSPEAVRATGPSADADFTIRVPVEVREVDPDFEDIGVACTVGNSGSPSTGFGSNATWRPLSGGSFVGTITVRVDVIEGRDPALVDRYSCHLQLRSPGTAYARVTNWYGNSGDLMKDYHFAEGASRALHTGWQPVP